MDALLGEVPDAELAARIGKSENAVRTRRWRLALMYNVTRLLDAAHAGDHQAAAGLLPLVDDELRTLTDDALGLSHRTADRCWGFARV